eukprot:scaffold126795_cov57-Phaeocystis_antarctica.AAC.1
MRLRHRARVGGERRPAAAVVGRGAAAYRHAGSAARAPWRYLHGARTHAWPRPRPRSRSRRGARLGRRARRGLALERARAVRAAIAARGRRGLCTAAAARTERGAAVRGGRAGRTRGDLTPPWRGGG